MTTVYIVTTLVDEQTAAQEAYVTLSGAKTRATDLRREGKSTLIDKVELRTLPKKELLAACFNRAGYDQSTVRVQSLSGVKNPRKP